MDEHVQLLKPFSVWQFDFTARRYLSSLQWQFVHTKYQCANEVSVASSRTSSNMLRTEMQVSLRIGLRKAFGSIETAFRKETFWPRRLKAFHFKCSVKTRHPGAPEGQG
uniref:Uncharacterized protein n=1 Tax=Trichuris muris TaxID=70415 RepID=A0A5S6QRN5_TRIMR